MGRKWVAPFPWCCITCICTVAVNGRCDPGCVAGSVGTVGTAVVNCCGLCISCGTVTIAHIVRHNRGAGGWWRLLRARYNGGRLFMVMMVMVVMFFLVFNYNLALQQGGRWQLDVRFERVGVERPVQQHVAKYFSTVVCYLRLLNMTCTSRGRERVNQSSRYAGIHNEMLLNHMPIVFRFDWWVLMFQVRPVSWYYSRQFTWL